MCQVAKISGSLLAVALTAGQLQAGLPRTGPAQWDHLQVQAWQGADVFDESGSSSTVHSVDPLTIVPTAGPRRINVTGGFSWPQAAVNLPDTNHADSDVLWSTPPVVPLPPALGGGILLGAVALHALRKQKRRSKARMY